MLVVIGGDAPLGAGIVLIGVAGLVVLANVMMQLSLQSERDRRREAERREERRPHRDRPSGSQATTPLTRPCGSY